MVAEEREKTVLPVELWATDEHRLGLKPVRRRVWAPVGERPTALGHHRFDRLYVTAFSAAALCITGFWLISTPCGYDEPETLVAQSPQTVHGR